MQTMQTMQTLPTGPIVNNEHCRHSSVSVNIYGNCFEIRRGSLIYDAIPDRKMWSSVEEWRAEAQHGIMNDMEERSWPVLWTPEQRWFAQWFRQSNLFFGPVGLIKGPLEIFVRDSSTGYMIPLYMNLETGLFSAHGQAGASLRQLGIISYETYRFEDEVFYRLT